MQTVKHKIEHEITNSDREGMCKASTIVSQGFWGGGGGGQGGGGGGGGSFTFLFQHWAKLHCLGVDQN